MGGKGVRYEVQWVQDFQGMRGTAGMRVKRCEGYEFKRYDI